MEEFNIFKIDPIFIGAKGVFKALQPLYPDVVKTIYIVNYGNFFEIMMKMIKPFLNQGTLSVLLNR